MAITRSGNRVTVLGHKLSGTVTAAGVLPGSANPDQNSYLEDTVNMAGNVPTIVESGTVDAPCRYNPGTGLRETLHETGKNFLTNCTYGDIAHQKTDNIFNYVRPFGGPGVAHMWCDNIFYDYGENDDYDVYGKQPGDSANYLNIFDSNLLIMLDGPGAGQVRSIKLTMDGMVVLNHGLETVPDVGDSYIIAWSPADIVHAFAAAGVINTVNNGRAYGLVEVMDDAVIGNGVTETSFGWSGYAVSMTDLYPASWGWSSLWVRYTNSTMYLGEWNPVARRIVDHAVILNYASLGNQSNIGGVNGTPEAKSYGTARVHLAAGSIDGTTTESAFTEGLGEKSSYRCIGFPITLVSDSDYYKYPGGNWGEPLANMPTLSANAIILGSVCEYDGDQAPTVRGLGWHGSNTGDPGDFFVRWINGDWGIVGIYQIAGIDVDWFWVDTSLTMNSSYFWTKIFSIVVRDSDAQPIEDVVVAIRSWGGELASYVDTGSVINEPLNKTETGIDVTDVENLETGDQLKVDQEYILAGTVPGGTGNGTITGCTRANIHAPGHVASLHEQSSLNYDPRIFRLSEVLTDADGQAPEMLIDYGYWCKKAHEVLHDGDGTFKPYKCILSHDSSVAATEPGAGGSWSTYWSQGSGTEKHQWRNDKKYINGTFTSIRQISISEWGPFQVTMRKYGYHTHTMVINPSFDSRGVDLNIQLVTDEALGGISEAQAASMPITYDPGTNTIVIGKDGTWFYDDATACTPFHLYAKSQYENWDVIHTHVGGEQYTCDAKIEVGDGIDAVYFKAENTQWTWADGIATADNTILFRVKSSSVARFGRVLDAGKKYTGFGCSVHIESSVYTVQVRADSGGTLSLYSTQYHQPNGLLYYSNDAWNCTFSGGMAVGVQAPDIDFFLLTIEGTGSGGPSGFQINGGLGDFNRISMLNVAYGLDLCQCFSNQAVMTNILARVTDGGTLGGPDAGFFVDIVNSDFDDWSNPSTSIPNFNNYEGTIRRLYTMDIKVLDREESELQNATVTLKDKNAATVFSVSTDVNGDIAKQDVVEATQLVDQLNPVTLSPFTLTIEKGGYDDYVETFVMPINRIDGFTWVFNLLTQQPVIDLQDGI